MFKRLALIFVLLVPFAFAATYHITLGDKTQAGTAQLKAGDYDVTVKGSQAVFRDENGKETAIAVTMGKADSKFSDTSVVCSSTSGASRLEYIGIKGTTEKLVFNP